MSDWIVSSPDVLGGKPCIRGTRITVEFILELLANGGTPEGIILAYPHIESAGLKAALEYAARSMKNKERIRCSKPRPL